MAPILRNRIPVSSIRKQLNLFFMISTSLVIPVTSSIFMDEPGRDCGAYPLIHTAFCVKLFLSGQSLPLSLSPSSGYEQSAAEGFVAGSYADDTDSFHRRCRKGQDAVEPDAAAAETAAQHV